MFEKNIDFVKKMVYRVFPFLGRYHNFRLFVKFCLVGSTNVLLDMSTYIVATRFFHIYFIYASIISFVVAVTWSFFINRRWTFQDAMNSETNRKYIKFFTVNTIGAIIQIYVLYIFVEMFYWNDIVVKAHTIVIIAFWNFSLSRIWVFRVK